MSMTTERVARFLPKHRDVVLPKPGHECPTCYVSNSITVMRLALEQLDRATESWLNEDCERDMSFAWLAGEVEAILNTPWWKPCRRRLRRALEIAE